MPEPNNDQTGSPANQQNQSMENRSTRIEDTQRMTQDARLREQSFEATEASNPDHSHEKRKRMEISL